MFPSSAARTITSLGTMVHRVWDNKQIFVEVYVKDQYGEYMDNVRAEETSFLTAQQLTSLSNFVDNNRDKLEAEVGGILMAAVWTFMHRADGTYHISAHAVSALAGGIPTTADIHLTDKFTPAQLAGIVQFLEDQRAAAEATLL